MKTVTVAPSTQRRLRRALLLFAASCVLSGSAMGQTEPRGSEATQIPTGPYRIAGTLVNSKTGNVLALSRVTIADSKNRQKRQSVITGENGRFEFHVPAGKYSLEGAKRGFTASAYNQHEQFSTAIVTGADLDTENLVLRLGPEAVFSGKVLDESGDPAGNALITVYRQDRSLGVNRVFPYRNAQTDDLGRYEVAPIQEGIYFVSAAASPWYAVHPSTLQEGAPALPSHVDPSLDVAYPVTYYGDVAEPADAAPITVHDGDRIEADIHLNPVPALHLTFRVPEGSGPGRVPMLYKPGFDGEKFVQGEALQGFPNGTFEVNGIAPGRYMVRMPDANGMKEPVEVNLDRGGEFDLPSGNSMSQIKAGVQIAGQSSLPAQLHIVLHGDKGNGGQAVVDAKGEANFSDVPSGKYQVVAGTATEPYSVVRITSEAGTTFGHELNVPPGASLTVMLSLAGGSATVEGFAKRDGKAVSGAMIVLVPKGIATERDRFRRDQSDLDGSFSLPNVIPGVYTVIAIEDGWDLGWGDPTVLEKYLKRGQTIEVGDRQKSQVHLPDAVDVQVK
jgi:Carboxypeptidase regulatory-like domain